MTTVHSSANSYSHLSSASTKPVLLRPRCSERCHIYANRARYSKQYLVAYGLMILINIGLLIWVLMEADYPLAGTHPARWVFVLADLFVTAFILLEVIINAGAVGWRRFWKQWSNCFDVLVALLCISVIGMHVLGPLAELEQEEEVETGVLTCRYAAQIARLGVMLKNLKRQAQQKELSIDISFTDDSGLVFHGQSISPRTHDNLSIDSADSAASFCDQTRDCWREDLKPQIEEMGTSGRMPEPGPCDGAHCMSSASAPEAACFTVAEGHDIGSIATACLGFSSAQLVEAESNSVAIQTFSLSTVQSQGTRPGSPTHSTYSAFCFTDPKLGVPGD